MADISAIKSTERTIDILHPATGEPIGVRVTLVSIDDDRLTKIRRAITDQRMRLEQKGKPFKAEEIEENANNLLFAAIVDWEWYSLTESGERTTFHDEIPDFNRRNFNAIIGELPWFKKQINEAVGEESAFFGK